MSLGLAGVAAVVVAALWAADRVDAVLFTWEMRRANKWKRVVSRVNGRAYDVAHGQEAADVLARAQALAWQVLTEARARLADGRVPVALRDGVRRLSAEVRAETDIRVAELNDYESNVIAFNRNKGEHILLCVTDDQRVVSVERVLFVLLHELAHTATRGYDPIVGGRTQHSDEFFAYEQYLYTLCAEMGIDKPRTHQGGAMCGTRIAHPRAATLPG